MQRCVKIVAPAIHAALANHPQHSPILDMFSCDSCVFMLCIIAVLYPPRITIPHSCIHLGPPHTPIQYNRLTLIDILLAWRFIAFAHSNVLVAVEIRTRRAPAFPDITSLAAASTALCVNALRSRPPIRLRTRLLHFGYDSRSRLATIPPIRKDGSGPRPSAPRNFFATTLVTYAQMQCTTDAHSSSHARQYFIDRCARVS